MFLETYYIHKAVSKQTYVEAQCKGTSNFILKKGLIYWLTLPDCLASSIVELEAWSKD